MLSYSEPVEDATSAQKAKRRSVSSIPRPVSGTSRRTTPLGYYINSQPLITSYSSDQQDGVQLAYTTKAPPSSWKTPQRSLPKSDSMLPYSERKKQDLSGVKQQLQIRHLSTHSLADPEAIAAPKPARHSTSDSLTKPNAVNSPTYSAKELTPRRHLMKPLDPPLPRSRTMGELSTVPSSAPSMQMSKPAQFRYKPIAPTRSRRQVSVVDALKESRMSDEEIQVLNQVQKESATNQLRLQRAFHVRQHKQTSPSPKQIPQLGSFLHKSDSIATINLSANDVINTTRIEEQRNEATSNIRPLFVNSNLANASKSLPDLLTPSTVTTTTTSSSGPEEEWETNLKLVYFAEEIPYWIGRYMTICSRLRTEEMALPRQPSPTSPSAYIQNSGFDATERNRTETALHELRICCRTTEAVKSFEKFESELRNTSAFQTSIPKRAHAKQSCASQSIRNPTLISSALKQQFDLPNSQNSAASEISGTEVAKPASCIETSDARRRIGLTKSKTTGSLATLPVGGRVNISKSNRSSPFVSLQHLRHASYYECSPETRAKALREREQRAAKRASDARRLTSEESFQSLASTATNNRKLFSPRLTAPNTNRLGSLTAAVASPEITKKSQYANIGNETTCALLENGHPPPLPKPSSITSSDLTSRYMTEIVNGEKVVRPNIKSERQGSGEMVRSILGASIREAKRIGRRVSGSISWGNSSEDLNVLMSKDSSKIN